MEKNNEIIKKPIINDKHLQFNYKSPKDRVVCKICRVTYTRNGLTKHRKTKKHMMYQDMHDRFSNVLFNTPFDPLILDNLQRTVTSSLGSLLPPPNSSLPT